MNYQCVRIAYFSFTGFPGLGSSIPSFLFSRKYDRDNMAVTGR